MNRRPRGEIFSGQNTEFQEAIDRQAMKQGLAGTDAYLAHWQWSERQERSGDPPAVLAAVVRDLEGSYDEGDRRA